jgi:hypothetical protein
MAVKKKKIIDNLDLSTITTTLSVPVVGDFSKYDYISIQHEWESVTGTLDATIDFQLKNSSDATLYRKLEDIPVPITTAVDSSIQEHVSFAGSYINILITINNVTGGLLNSYLVAKSK